jgi:hypothetical protein
VKEPAYPGKTELSPQLLEEVPEAPRGNSASPTNQPSGFVNAAASARTYVGKSLRRALSQLVKCYESAKFQLPARAAAGRLEFRDKLLDLRYFQGISRVDAIQNRH